MTAAAVVAATNSSSADVSGGGLSHACALPASIAAGDLLIVVIGVWGPSGLAGSLQPGTPSGWTSINTDLQDDFAFVLGWRSFYKIASGSEGSSVTASWAAPGATSVVAISARLTGAHATTPIDDHQATAYYSDPPSVTVTSGKTDSLLISGILYAYPLGDPTTPSGYTALAGASGGAYGAHNYAAYKATSSSGATSSPSYLPPDDGAGGYGWTIAVAPSTDTTAVVMVGLDQTATFGAHDVAGDNAIVMSGLNQTATFGVHDVTAANTDQTIVGIGLSQVATFGAHDVVQATTQTVVMMGLSQVATFGSPTIVPVIPFTGRSLVIPWGASRRWNAWVEFYVGADQVASSANGDFALLGGRLTEDISRPIRRDVQVSLLFPTGQTRTTGAVYSAAEASPFITGTSDVGGTDALGGGGVATAVLTPARTATTTRSVYVPTAVGDLLDPNGPTVMRIWAGFYGEEVLMGTFDLSSVPVRVTEGGASVDVTGQSFERRIAKAGFWEVEAATSGSPASLVAASLVLTALPETEVVSVLNNTGVADLTWKPGDNRLTKVTDLLTTAGLEGGFDRDNRFVMTEAPSVGDFGTENPQWAVLDGRNARIATLNSATRDFSDEDSYNGVVIEGDSHDSTTTAPILYTLWNTNVGSPLFYDPDNPSASLVGPRPKYVRSDLVRTAEDAANVAQAELAKVLMISDSIEATVPANAGIQMGHFARVASEDLGLDGVYRVTRVVHDLAGGPASLSLYRYQQV